MSADQCKGTTNNIWIATPMVLAAVDLQWNLVCLLKEFLSYAQHSKLVICRFRLGKAGLYDEDSDRNTASTAEFFDVNQPRLSRCAKRSVRRSLLCNQSTLRCA